MTRDDIAAGLDEAATWDECASYPAPSRAALESRDADARRESAMDPATYPGGRGTGANPTPQERAQSVRAGHSEWCSTLQGYPCNCGYAEVEIQRQDALGALDEQDAIIAEQAADEPSVPEWAKAMFDAQAGMIAEQAERIDAQADIIAELHVANKHLASRIDKVEDESIRDDVKILARISTLAKATNKGFQAMVEFKARVIAAYPKAGEPTIQQQCDAVTYRGPTEEGDRE